MNLFNPYIIKMFKLRAWIDETKLTKFLSLNINAVEYLEEHPEKIDYYYISENINAIHIIEKNIDKCSVEHLHRNPNMMTLLRNQSLINYPLICYYEHGIEFVEELIKNNELDKINWTMLSFNSVAIHMLEQYPKQIDWHHIIYNKNAERLIHDNIDNVDVHWNIICRQPHLISLIESYPENINWHGLSFNHNADHLLKNNLDKIYIDAICLNKNGFELLLQLGHQFNSGMCYHTCIVYEFFDYCKSHNVEFTLIEQLCKFGYTDEHFEFIQTHKIYYDEISKNPHIFEYDYSRMKKTRREQPWYNDIKNEFI